MCLFQHWGVGISRAYSAFVTYAPLQNGTLLYLSNVQVRSMNFLKMKVSLTPIDVLVLEYHCLTCNVRLMWR